MNIGFLASHNGTTMKGIIAAINQNILEAKAKVIISNNSVSGAMKYADKIGLPHYHISDITHPCKNEKDDAIKASLLKHDVDIVILSGYMKKIGPHTRKIFGKKILNVHPALLPKYKGLWGEEVHKAVLIAGEKITGVTIHTITGQYDEGDIICQLKVKVKEYDTVQSLKSRVQKVEIKAFIKVLNDIKTNNIRLD